MELAIAEYFNVRQNLIVPNVSWGFGIHECDLFLVTKSGFCYEIEIKVTKSDLLVDAKKRHHHLSPKIRKLFFAIPEYLVDTIPRIPAAAGILVISIRGENLLKFSCQQVRGALVNPCAVPLSAEQRFDIARLGALRIWTLKKKIREMKDKL